MSLGGGVVLGVVVQCVLCMVGGRGGRGGGERGGMG